MSFNAILEINSRDDFELTVTNRGSNIFCLVSTCTNNPPLHTDKKERLDKPSRDVQVCMCTLCLNIMYGLSLIKLVFCKLNEPVFPTIHLFLKVITRLDKQKNSA